MKPTTLFFLLRACALCATLALPAGAAQFDLSMLIRYGQNGNGGGTSWEIGVGANSSSLNTSSISPNWQNGSSREFQLRYTASTNTVQLRLYQNGSNSNFDSASYTMAGTGGNANTVWTLPASMFFASATPNSQGFVGESVSGLSLTSLTGAAINVIQPFQSTSMNVDSNAAVTTIAQSKDIIFKGDTNGNWRLGGFITMNFSSNNGGPPATSIQFGSSATATPEPSTWMSLSVGLLAVGWKARKRRR